MNWRWFAAALVASVGVAGGAQAADTLAYGAAPAWVRPLTLEPDLAGTPANGLAVLMHDREVRYGADYDESYEEMAIKALSPAGLNVLGSITRSWNPATTAVTINRLEIVRAGQVIDALAPGSPAGSDPFLVLRRETNLNLATLDGVLTATKQLNGLQVGDIVRLAVTERTHDPLLNGLTEDYTTLGGPIAHAQVRLLWPKSKPVRWKTTEGFGDPRVTATADGSELLLDRRNIPSLISAEGAPGRYRLLGVVEVSELADWPALSRLFFPLYDKASTLAADSPLKAEAARIRAANPTKAGQAAAALKLVEDQVRYVALAMGEGGLNPAAADLTWSRRFGDCKGKTAMLLALLRELGIEAQPALANADGADGFDQLLPAVIAFNHVIVRAVVDGKVYWLDGTRQGDGALAQLPVPDMDWVLPLSRPGVGLERLVVPMPAEAQEQKLISFDLSGGKSEKTPAKIDYSLRGDYALGARLAMAQIDPSVSEATLKSVLKSEFNIDYSKASMSDQDGVVTLHGEGMAATSWYTDSVSRRPAVDLGGAAYGYFDALPDRSLGFNPDAPMALDYPNFQSTRIVITLPADAGGFNTSGADSDITAGGVRITRTTHTDGRTVTIDQTSRTLQSEIALAEAKTAITRFKDAPTDKAVVLLAPRDFAITTSQLAAAAAADPTNAVALTDLGDRSVKEGRYAEAVNQYEAAIKAQPDYARAWWARAWAKARLGDYTSAMADADKGVGLDPQAAFAFYYRGFVRTAMKDDAKAIDDFTAALKLDPTLSQVLQARANAETSLKRFDQARADIDAAIKLDPENTELRSLAFTTALAAKAPKRLEPADYLAETRRAYAGVTGYDGLYMRGRSLLSYGAAEDGLADLAAAIKLDPDRVDAYTARGAYLLSHDKAADGESDMARVIALSPTADSYILRGQSRQRAKDYAGARADFIAAAAKDPAALNPGLSLAGLAQVQGDKAGALAELDKLIAAHPDKLDPYTRAVQIYVAHKNYADAERIMERALTAMPVDINALRLTSGLYETAGDYARALAITNKAIDLHPDNGALLNGRCYIKAEANIQIDTALADCNAALRLAPNSAAILDSRAMVYLRRGEWDLAIADYDAALKLAPTQADSSFGRAIARARKGDAVGSSADLADATRVSPDIAQKFADMGLKP